MTPYFRSAVLRLPTETERHATWLELFFDLIFVAVITELGSRFSHDFSYTGIFQTCVLVFPVMWTWTSYTVFAARFDNNDWLHWLLTFSIMFAAVIMAIQIPTALEDGRIIFAVAFIASQLSLLLLYARTLIESSTFKTLTLFYLTGFSLGDICWIISLFFQPPFIFIFWTLGMLIYMIMPWLGRKKILSKSPLHSDYIPERFGSFTIIIIGQTIASVVIGLKSTTLNGVSFVAGLMAFILAILIWSQYYRLNQIANYKCTLRSGQPYIYTHIPLIIGLMMIGACSEFYIKQPLVIDIHVNNVFFLSIILYLSSFYILQYISFINFTVRVLSYIFTIVIILTLFFLKLTPISNLIGMVMIFSLLFSFQYWLGSRVKKSRR